MRCVVVWGFHTSFDYLGAKIRLIVIFNVCGYVFIA